MFFFYILNPLLTKLVPSRWLDIGFVCFLRDYIVDLDSVYCPHPLLACIVFVASRHLWWLWFWLGELPSGGHSYVAPRLQLVAPNCDPGSSSGTTPVPTISTHPGTTPGTISSTSCGTHPDECPSSVSSFSFIDGTAGKTSIFNIAGTNLAISS